ncbi:MAG: zf-HC2 domain-containing protein [Pseudomonadota bacterium]
MKTCTRYDTLILSRFVDDELGLDVHAAVRDHLESCRECEGLVSRYRNAADTVNQALSRVEDTLDLGRIHSPVPEQGTWNPGMGNTIFGWLFRKNVLQMASIIAIIVSTWAYVEYRPVESAGPSAIVTSVDGNASSVMILETRGEHHTIIWFKEI